MKIDDLNYSYPKELVALTPKEPCRVMYAPEDDFFKEISLESLKSVFKTGDVLVVNNSGVKPCRVFFEDREILFLKALPENKWEVMFVSRGMKEGESFSLPGSIVATLVKKGRPQILKLDKEIGTSFFNDFGQPALPPYIQKLRESREPVEKDHDWYQTDWHKDQKSLAAPTASLHFKKSDLKDLENAGVIVKEVTLNVGLGTFLPLIDENIKEGKLHKESITVTKDTIQAVKSAKASGKRVWCIGTTALRAIESINNFDVDTVEKETDIFIQPGYEFKWVSGLLTNFHQPKSSLLALVMAFAGSDKTLEVYKEAVDKKFRLFSYGDLSVWTRPLP